MAISREEAAAYNNPTPFIVQRIPEGLNRYTVSRQQQPIIKYQQISKQSNMTTTKGSMIEFSPKSKPTRQVFDDLVDWQHRLSTSPNGSRFAYLQD